MGEKLVKIAQNLWEFQSHSDHSAVGTINCKAGSKENGFGDHEISCRNQKIGLMAADAWYKTS